MKGKHEIASVVTVTRKPSCR